MIVDNEKTNIELAGTYLQEEGCEILFALDGKKAFEMLHKHKVDLILIDVNMSGVDGFTVCKKLKEDPEFTHIPVIFLTAYNDINNITKAFEVGGVDYIIKPFNPLELKARVKTHLKVRMLVEELKLKQSKFAQLSISDAITKIPNSLYFDAQLKIALKNQKKVWIILLQIDKLDRLNKLYGFSKTNRILANFAKLLQESCIASAKVARLYGGSFGILFNNYPRREIEKNLLNIRKALQNTPTLHNVIKVNAVVYHVQEQKSLEQIYAKLQQGLKEINHSLNFSYFFIE
ncbi:response regulator [hydrothermal vent metagenome]|uniref:Response regulator n=1 Tax=hydrothermal vent metagenome TaxID=652676 RepID=A0A1W1C2F9_9ZZZZ